MIGLVIDGRFHIRSLIARGGMGRVYRAEQSPLGRVCALKVVNGTLAGADPEYERRFKLEASTAAKLTHPNTVTVFDYGKTQDGIFFMAMELLEGRTLHKILRDEGSLSPERAARVASQICRSLREAHHHGVVHRDLKPANVFLVAHGDEPDFVKVLDFGLVKALDERPEEQLTQTGIFMGSPKYMAPEQIEGHKVDARTDIYSLGVMLYEMLTGKVPFDKATSVKTLMAHVHEAPAALSMAGIPPALEDLVLRCLSKSPQERPSSMEEVLTALRAGAPQAAEQRRFSSQRVPAARPASELVTGDKKPSIPPPVSSVQERPASGQPVSSAQITKLLHGGGEVVHTAPMLPGTLAVGSSGDLSPVASSHPRAGTTSTTLAPLGRSRRPSRPLVAFLGALAVVLGGGLGLLAVHMRPPARVLSQAAPAQLTAEPVQSAPVRVAPLASTVAAPPAAAPVVSSRAASPPLPRAGARRRLPSLPHSKGDDADGKAAPL